MKHSRNNPRPTSVARPKFRGFPTPVDLGDVANRPTSVRKHKPKDLHDDTGWGDVGQDVHDFRR